MAKRIEFHFQRKGEVVMTGFCSVDVDDPFDAKEIGKKLKAQEFSEFLPTNVEWLDDDNWEFLRPVKEAE